MFATIRFKIVFCILLFFVLPGSLFVMTDAAALKEFFVANEVDNIAAKYLVDDCGLVKLKDFTNYVRKDKYEEELASIIQTRFPVGEDMKVEKQRLWIARLRAAYQAAAEQLENERELAKKKTDASEADLDKPLDEGTVEALATAWDQLHKWKPCNSMRGAPAMRTRIFREFRSKACSVLAVERAFSIEDVKRPRETTRTPLGDTPRGRLVYEEEQPHLKFITNVLDYLASLRLIMCVYAYCGSHPFTTKAGIDVIFFPWGKAPEYVDEAMMHTIRINLSDDYKLHWLRRRDEQLRGEMCALINDGYSGGEAITQAYEKYKTVWTMLDAFTCGPQISQGAIAARTELEVSPPPPPKVQKTGGKDHLKDIKTASLMKGVKYCGKYNVGQCRSEANCPQKAVHKCNVLIAPKKVCGSQNHTAITHHRR